MDVRVDPDSSLLLLPSPVTCFSRASYSQIQTFRLAQSSSLLLLDWYTSGRMSHAGGEEWQFSRYRSRNEVWIENKLVAKDVLLLEDDNKAGPVTNGAQETSYLHRVAPYSCYATILLFGPKMAPILGHLRAAFANITQYKQSRPYSMLWSFSELEKGHGGIARCAGDSTEAVKDWIVEVLKDGGIEGLIGADLWKCAFT
ncbi:urease accessory protein, partial [Phenoliferia sp. Uapishka_3]